MINISKLLKGTFEQLPTHFGFSFCHCKTEIRDFSGDSNSFTVIMSSLSAHRCTDAVSFDNTVVKKVFQSMDQIESIGALKLSFSLNPIFQSNKCMHASYIYRVIQFVSKC